MGCLALTLAACASTGPAGSGLGAISQQFCDDTTTREVSHQSRLLRFAGVVRDELNDSAESIALVSRSGLDLKRLGIYFTHSGITQREAGQSQWSVRQLYYACDEGRPRIFDQGMAGFLFGIDDPGGGSVSIILLPPEAADQLNQTVQNKSRALGLLATRYSANAYPFSSLYQNCNQWVIELLAAAWGELPDGQDLRERAQAWLASNAYAPEPVVVSSHWLKLAANFSPMIHLEDHPEPERYGLRFQVSLPRTIETFVRERYPTARRISLCQNLQHIVVRHGWQPIGQDCLPDSRDRVVSLQ